MIPAIEILQKACGENDKLLHILTTHSQQVARKAIGLAQLRPDLSIDISFVEEAALLHDIGIVQCYAPRIYCFGTHSYVEHGYLGANQLRNLGLPRHARVAERHTGTGITAWQIAERQLPIPMGDYTPETLEEQLICYADKFFSKSRLKEEVGVERIREKLQQYGSASVEQFDTWHKRFGHIG